jgi:tripartite-type tricarboxylate transporter receptor subunit TctC
MATNMLLGKVPFDIRKVYVHVVQLTTQPYVVTVNPALPVNSVKELIAYAKAKPGAISYGTPGTGSPAHLGIEQFKLMTDTSMVHVPYKGNGPAMIDLMSGQIQLVFGSAVSVAPQARNGKLKALAVTGPKRATSLPDVPTVSEAGVPGYELTNSYGFFGPAGTPAAIVDAINRQSNAVIAAREFKARLEADGVEAAPPNSPADYRGAVARDIANLEKFFKTPGISPDSFK